MAEFDSGGLSAVSAFFGRDKSDVEERPRDASHDVSRRGRQGVGASTKQVKLSATSDSTIGRVLKVGKRKRQDDDDGSGSYESDVQYDEEDEEGRTSLAAAKPKVSTNDKTPVQVRKKRGKKERQAKALETTVQQEQGAADSQTGEHETTTTEKDSEKAKQRKRRKIRSRQKNIYKDKRLTQHKPSHLILGRAEFVGRPLTAETRAKLNLAPSRSSRSQEHEDDTETVESSMHDSTSNGEGVKLAIDELLDEGVIQGENDNAVFEHKPIKKKTKKKKKSKYKNLQL